MPKNVFTPQGGQYYGRTNSQTGTHYVQIHPQHAQAGATIVGLAEFVPVGGGGGNGSAQLAASHWRPRNDSCHSYPAACKSGDTCPGGIDERHSGYEPLIGGFNITDVEVTGRNGTLVGGASRWWAVRDQLAHGRPHALFFSRCRNVVVSNVTIRGSAFWSLRFWARLNRRLCGSELNRS